MFADFVKNGSAELGFMRPRNECTELFAEHTYSPEHTYSACLSSCSPVQPIHPEQGLPLWWSVRGPDASGPASPRAVVVFERVSMRSDMCSMDGAWFS